ncbi:MAG: hypothetical protein ACREDS_15330, partial [Limisphaerales bacterium]
YMLLRERRKAHDRRFRIDVSGASVSEKRNHSKPVEMIAAAGGRFRVDAARNPWFVRSLDDDIEAGNLSRIR